MLSKSANVKNSIWNLANVMIYPISFLAATPLFINQMGASTFGVWMLLNSYVYISLNLIGFGLPNSITAHIAESIGLGSLKKLYGYVNAASRLLGMMALGMIMLTFIMWLLYLHGFYLFDEGIMKILIIATLLIAIKFPEILYQSIFKGRERFDLAGIFNISNRMLALGLQVIIVLAGYGLYEMFAATLLINTLLVIIQAVVVYRSFKTYRPTFFTKLEERIALYRFGFWTWLQTVIGVAAYQLDRFVVAAFLGTETVAYYVLATTIANQFHLAFEAVVGWLFPKVARMKEVIKDTRVYFHTLRSFSVGLSLLGILVIYVLSQPVFLFWLGPETFHNMIGFFYLFLVFEAFLILTIVPKFYLNGIKAMRLVTSMEFVYKASMIVGLCALFAIYGTAESLIWGQILALVITVPFTFALLNQSVLKENFWHETFLTMIPSAAVCMAILSDNWMFGLVFSIFAVLSFWFYYVRMKHFSLKHLLE